MLEGVRRYWKSLGLFPPPLWGRVREGGGPRHARCELLGTVLLAASLADVAFAQTPQQPRVTIGYVEIAGDPRYEPITAYGRLVLKSRERPFAGAQVGLDEAQALTRVLRIDFALERMTVSSASELASAVNEARDARGVHFFIVDAPAEALAPLAAA